MDAIDEAENIRATDDQWEAEDSRAERPGPEGTACLVAQTKTVTTYPTAASQYFAVTGVDVFGAEAEGGAGTITTRGDTFYAFNLGATIPPSGTNVIVSFTGNRWTFRYG